MPVPYTWTGSKAEWAIHEALRELGLKPDEDFIYQAPQFGGRLQYGGASLDFLLPDRNLAINIKTDTSVFTDAIMEGWGIKVVNIKEEDALSDPLFYTKEALEGREY